MSSGSGSPNLPTSWSSSLSSGKTLEDLAKEQNTQVLVTEPLKRSGLTVNVLPVAVTQAFALPQGGYGSAPSGVEEGRIVFQVDKVDGRLLRLKVRPLKR